MAFTLSRSNTPVVEIDSFDDSAFTAGDIAAWAALFVAEYRTQRAAGVLLLGQVRLGLALAERVMGSAPLMDRPVQHLTELSLADDGLQLYADSSLGADQAILL